MRVARRNPPRARDVYAIYLDAKKQAHMARGKGAKKEKLQQAQAILDEARSIDPEEWRYTGLITIDQLATLIGTTEYADYADSQWDYIHELALDRVGAEDFASEDARDEALAEAQGDIENEYVFRPWYNAIEFAAERMFGEHQLTLVPERLTKKLQNAGALPYRFKIEPQNTWVSAADSITNTMNGVGSYYPSAAAFIEDVGCTPRDAVLDHLHWMRRRPDVYGTTSYEQTFRNQL